MRSLIYSFVLLFSLSLLPRLLPAQDQSTCPNSDFNQGNFNGWEAYYGDFWTPAMNAGIMEGRHKLIQAPGTFDSYTCNELVTVPPGALYSARLGNHEVNYEAEQLRYTIDVTEETNLFIYKYAVVLEDPQHEPEEQPSFTITVTDKSGNLIDPVCGYYYVYAHQGMPSWHACGDIIWKDWTTVGVDLSQYVDQTITIVFTTRDCAQGGHFGYAYISAYCSKLEILFGYCPNDTIATVTAPPGFSYLWSNGDTEQTTIVKNPAFGTTFSCTLTSVNGCQVTITGSFKPTIVDADFSFPPTCFGSNTHFTDLSTINQSEITNWKWDFGDGSPPVSGRSDPDHVYDSLGSFETTLVVYSTGGCPDTARKTITLVRVPEVRFSTNYTCGTMSNADTIYFDKLVRLAVDNNYDKYTWSTGDITPYILVQKEGWYGVTIENGNLCSSSDSIMMIDCNLNFDMPNAFTPNSDGINDYFRPVTQTEKVYQFIMKIYSRWGQQIFETRDVSKGWDGMINGSVAPAGVYRYILSYSNRAGESKNQEGLVTLLR